MNSKLAKVLRQTTIWGGFGTPYREYEVANPGYTTFIDAQGNRRTVQNEGTLRLHPGCQRAKYRALKKAA